MIEKAPIEFQPYLKSVIWGGDGICLYKHISQPEPSIGESWEISAVAHHESVVAVGPYKGMTLVDLIDRFGASLLGERVAERYGGKFPLLIKFIDANDNLSVQVHPDDALAMKRHNSPGKTEMWYVIGVKPGARIYAGFNTAITPDEYERRVADGTFMNTLAVHVPSPGSVYFLPAGCVHAIGAGNLLAEIQESSDITYRIYDYDRRDAAGHKRELHTELAKDAIDYRVYNADKSHDVSDDQADAEMVRCDHFTTRRILLDGTKELPLSDGSFTIVMCVAGDATLSYEGGETHLGCGASVLLPAAMTAVTATGRATLLTANC